MTDSETGELFRNPICASAGIALRGTGVSGGSGCCCRLQQCLGLSDCASPAGQGQL